jgi:hypothetical protein
MKLKLDENVGHTPKQFLIECGHDADRVYDEDLTT